MAGRSKSREPTHRGGQDREARNSKPAAPRGVLDLAVPSTPANSFLTDICMWFIRERGNWRPSRTWVTLLGALEIPAPTARTALHRMTKAGFLERQAHDGQRGYAMSRAWLDLWDRNEREAPTRQESEELWTLVVFSIPEARRADRHTMRTLLGRHGFAPLGNGVWIGSAAHLQPVRSELEFTTFAGNVDLFHARYEGSMALPELASRCWDLDSMQAAYAGFIRDVRRRLRREPTEGEGAFTAVVKTSNAWRRLNFRDPLLPLSALPGDWPRTEASRLHDELVERFLSPARGYVASHD